MMDIPRRKFSRLLTQWLNDQLGAVSNGFGNHQQPVVADDTKAWGIVYSILGGNYDDTGPFEEYGAGVAMLPYQVSSISAQSAEHAEWFADRVRELMFSLPEGYPAVPAPPGWRVVAVDPQGGPGGVIASDDDPANPNRVFSVPETFNLRVSPA
jgi:hypothetical protein